MNGRWWACCSGNEHSAADHSPSFLRNKQRWLGLKGIWWHFRFHRDTTAEAGIQTKNIWHELANDFHWNKRKAKLPHRLRLKGCKNCISVQTIWTKLHRRSLRLVVGCGTKRPLDPSWMSMIACTETTKQHFNQSQSQQVGNSIQFTLHWNRTLAK